MSPFIFSSVLEKGPYFTEVILTCWIDKDWFTCLNVTVKRKANVKPLLCPMSVLQISASHKQSFGYLRR